MPDEVPEPHGRAAGTRAALLIAAVGAFAVPGLAVRVAGAHPANWLAAVTFGLAIVSAAFLLAWAAEVVQLDVSAGLALALLALIAVLPEYAVDFVFTWKAGHDPKHYAPLALANMTGGNQLLIGIGWSLVVLLAASRVKRRARLAGTAMPPSTDIALERSHAVEIAFLAVATVYGLTLPLRHTLHLVDAVVLGGLFVGYLIRIARAPAEEPHLVGPALAIAALPVATRRAVTVALFVGAAGIILLCAEHFAQALVDTGHEFGISDFLLVKWLAPIASEAPELLVAALFAWRLNTNSALGALVSSKVNQWTLLVGSLPVVFAIASSTHHGLPIDAMQREELFVTAAQSAFAVAVLANRSISVREGRLLLGLFASQFLLGAVLTGSWRGRERVIVGTVYLALAAWTIARQRRSMRDLLVDGFARPYRELVTPKLPS